MIYTKRGHQNKHRRLGAAGVFLIAARLSSHAVIAQSAGDSRVRSANRVLLDAFHRNLRTHTLPANSRDTGQDATESRSTARPGCSRDATRAGTASTREYFGSRNSRRTGVIGSL